MQTFSPLFLAQAGGPVLPSPQNPTAVWQAFQESVGAGRMAAFVAASVATSVLAAWIASKPVAGESATFGRATQVVLAEVASFIMIVIAAAVALPFAQHDARPGVILAAGVIFIGVVLLALLGIPMVVYGLNFLRSVGFVLIQFVLGGVMHFALQWSLLGSIPTVHPEVYRQVFPTPTPSPAQVDALRGALHERQEVLKRRHEMLEIESRHLPPGNVQAREDYERKKAAYEADVERLRADAGALPHR